MPQADTTDDLVDPAAAKPPPYQPINRGMGASALVPSAPSDAPARQLPEEQQGGGGGGGVVAPPQPAQPDYQPIIAPPPGRVPPQQPGPLAPPGRAAPEPPVFSTGNRQQDAAARNAAAQENYQDRLARFNSAKMYDAQQSQLKQQQQQDAQTRADAASTYAGQQQEKVAVNREAENTLKRLHVATEVNPATGLIQPERDDKGIVQYRTGEGPIAVDKELHGAARDALGQDVYQSALNLKQLQQTSLAKQEELKNLNGQVDDLTDRAGKTEGGFLGMGKTPTPDAVAAKAKLDEINPQIDALQQAGYGKLTAKGNFEETPDVTEAKKAHAALTADKTAWGQVAPKELGQLDDAINERKASILAAGGDPSQDRVLSVIEAKKNELGIANQTPEIVQAQAQVAPLQARSDKLVSRLESLLGLDKNMTAPGGDPDARLGLLMPQIASLTDPAQKGRAQTVLNALQPILDQLRVSKATLQTATNARDAAAQSDQTLSAQSDQQGDLRTNLGPLGLDLQKHEDVAGVLQKYTEDGYRKLPDNSVTIHPADPAKGVENAVSDGAISATDAKQHGPEVIKTATAAQNLSAQNPQADGTQPPVETISGLHATLDRTAIEGARGFDKAVEGILRFADSFSQMQVGGAPEKGGSLTRQFADYLKDRTQKMSQILAGESVDGQEKLSKESAQGASGVVSKVAGGLIGQAPGLAAGGIPGLLTMAMTALGQSSAEARDIKINDGGSEAEGDKAGYLAAVKTLPTLALYGAAGKVTGALMKELMPVGASPFFRAATTFAVQAPMNMAASSGGKLIVGENPKPTMDSAITDAIFASLGVRDAYTHGKDVKIAQSMIAGEHPEIATMNGIAENKTGAFKPEMQDLAQIYANRMRAIAQQFLAKNGEKIPESSTAGAVEPAAKAEKQASAREVAPTAPEVVPTTPTEQSAALGAVDTTQHPDRIAAIDDQISKGGATPALQTQRDKLTTQAGQSQAIHAASQEIDGLQPSEHMTPEQVGPTQNALRGLVKIATGQPLEALTSAERVAVLAKGPDGIARVEMVKGPDGAKPVITDATLGRVSAIAPTTAQLLPASEHEQRQAILNPVNETETEPSQSPSAPSESSKTSKKNSENIPAEQPTFAVEVQNAKGETKVIEAKAATAEEAHSQVAQTIPPGKGLIKDVTQVSVAPHPASVAAAQNPTTFVDQAVQQVSEQAGRDLKPAEEKSVRDMLQVVAPHYERWQRAFDAVNVTLQKGGTAGAAYTPKGNGLTISLPDLARHLPLYEGKPKSSEALITHEAAHAITVTSGADVGAIFKAAPQDLKDAVKSFYHTKDPSDYTYGHEMWAYMLAGKIQLAKGQKIKVNGRFLPEQASRKFLFANRRALAVILRYVRDTEGELRKAGQSEESIATWKQAEKLFLDKAKEVDAHASGASEKGTIEKTGQTEVSTEGHPARGPPVAEQGGGKPAAVRAGATESVTGSGKGAAAVEKVPAGAVEPAAGEKLATEIKSKLASGLNLPSGAVGHASKITQNGRTVNVAFVAQDSSAARPSHDAQGRVTPGYDQSLQPRDRSLPQYRKQSQNIATNLDFAKSAFFPETTTPATTADLGAPVMTQGGDTLIGNGREIGIKSAYDQNLTAARKYKADFVRNAAAFGIDPEAVMGMKSPILKRVITDDLSKDDLVRLSQESNEGAAMASNATEVANRDASRLNPQLLSLFDPNYGLDSTKNLDFLRAYQRDVVQIGGTANEANLTGSELTSRIRRAVFSYAYGMDETGRAAMDRMAGDESDAGKTITNALLTVAPIMGRMRSDITAGALFPGFDISPSLTRAAQDLSNALQNRPKNQSSKAALEGLLGQGNLFATDPMDRAVLEFLVDNRGKRAAIEEGLSNYAESVYRLGSPQEGQLFGEQKPPTAQELWQRATTPEAVAPKTEERTLLAQQLNTALAAHPLISQPRPQTHEVDQRLQDAFGAQHSFNALGLPNHPRTLEAKNRHDLLQPTEDKTTATVHSDSRLAHLGIMKPGEYSRGQLHAAIFRHFLSGGTAESVGDQKLTSQEHPEIVFLGGGGGAGKTTILLRLQAEGVFDFKNRVLVNTDEIRSLLPEYQEINALGDARSSNVTQEESSTLAKKLLKLAEQRKYNITFDATMGNPDKSLPGIREAKALGYTPRFVGVTVDPYEAAVRSYLRAKETDRYVPDQTLFEAHKGFNKSTAAYVSEISAKNSQLFDNTPPLPTEISVDGTVSDAYKEVDARANLDPAAPTKAQLLESYGRRLERQGVKGDEMHARGVHEATTGTPGEAGQGNGPAGESRLSSQQIDLFGQYAKTLPAATRASKPALKAEVAKDVPALSDNEAALSELFDLANKPPKATPTVQQNEDHRINAAPEENPANAPVAIKAGDAGSEKPADDTRGSGLPEKQGSAGRNEVPARDAAQSAGEIPGDQTPALSSQPTEPERALFDSGLPLAKQIASRYSNIQGVEPSDVQQHAQIALARASKSFDPSRGAFLPFARNAINNEMLTLYRDRNRFKQMANATSLDAPLTNSDYTAKDLLPSKTDVRSDVQLAESRRVLDAAVAELPARMQGAISGILDGNTLDVIGQELGGISRQAVARLATRAMQKLRGKLGEHGITGTGDLLSQNLDIVDAHIADTLAAQASADPLQQLIDSMDADHLEQLFDKANAEERGSYVTGRPDLAMGAEGAAQRAVDQYYTDLWKPKTRAEMAKEGEQILAEQGAGFANEIARKWLNGDTLHNGETFAAKSLLSELSRDTGTPEGLQRMMATGFAYRNMRGQTGRDLGAGFDPHKTPEERNREFLTKIISTLPAPKEAEIQAEPDPAKKRSLLDAAMKERLGQLEKAFAYLSKGGLTLDDILNGSWELHGKGTKLIENEMAGFDVPHQQALKLAQTGTRTAKEIAKATGLTEGEVERVNDQMISSLRDKLRDKVKAGLTLEKIDMQGALLAQPTGAEPPALSDEAVNAELNRIIKGMGFVASKDLGKFKVVKSKRRKLFVPPKVPADVRTANEDAAVPYPEGQTAPYTGRVLGQPGLPLYQEMMVRKGADLSNSDDVVKIARVAQAANGNRADMIYEAWINSILSGPTTHIAYKMALAANSAFEFTIQRGAEALVNLLVRDPESATFKEFGYIRKAILPGIINGLSIGARQWNTESDIFQQEIMNSQVEMFDKGQVPATEDFHAPSISETPLTQFFGPSAGPLEKQFARLGKYNPVRGRVMRMPTRLLWFIDGFYKTANSQIGVGPIAYRMARREGLEGDALSKRVNELVATAGGPAWIKAADLAQWLALRQQVKTSEQGGNWIDNAVARVAAARNGSHLIGSQIPFVQLPYNFVKIGMGKAFSPVTTAVKIAAAAAKALPHPGYDPSSGFFKMKDGKPFIENYGGKAKLVRDVATSLIAATAASIIWNIAAGDGDDDKKWLLITGSTPATQLKKGVKELQQRAYGGSYVLRIGGRGGLYFNYGKYEPGATVLGTLTDAVINIKHLVRGELGPKEAMDAFAGYLIAQAEDKTFLRALANISRVMQGEMGITDFAAEMVVNGIVPNLVRQPLRNLDDYIPDYKHSSDMYRLFPTASNAQPKIDLYGKPVAKTGNWFTRMFTIASARPYPQLEKADALLLRWNNDHPRDAHAPSPPLTTYTGTGEGKEKTKQMTPEQSTKFLMAVGHRFEQTLRGQISQHQIDHPKEEDVKMIEKMHRDAVEQTKREMFPKGAAPAPKRTANIVRQWMQAA